MSRLNIPTKETYQTSTLPGKQKLTASEANSIVSSINALYDSLGWMTFTDTIHTELNKQTILAEVPTTLTIVDSTPIDEYKPTIIGDNLLWTGNKITPHAVGDTYTLRIDFTASIDNSQGYFGLAIDVNGAIGEILSKDSVFPKERNTPHEFSFTIKVFCRETFVQNGGEIKITPSHDMLIWNKRIFLDRGFGGELK